MATYNNITVSMSPNGTDPLVTNTTAELSGTLMSVISTDWKHMPTPNDGREYYIIQEGGKTWKGNCNGIEGTVASFKLT